MTIHPVIENGKRVAVVGSGISGMTAAFLLSKKHHVTLFEAEPRPGGHTHTHTLKRPDGIWNVDTGFIVYNERTYPNLIALLTHFGIQGQPGPMTFSVRNEKTDFEFKASSLDTMFSQRSNILNPGLYKLMAEIFRFRKESTEVLAPAAEPVTLGEYLHQKRYSELFVSHFIIPMGAAIWSSTVRIMMEFPASFFVRFFHNHGFLNLKDQPQWLTIPGGSSSYIPGMLKPLGENIQLNTPVTTIKRFDDHVEIHTQTGLAGVFDYVVIAVHSNQALRIVHHPADIEHNILKAFRYQPNHTVLHTDVSMMPHRKKTWASWNYHITPYPDQPVAVSYNMNILQSIPSADNFIVTLNRSRDINPDTVIHQQTYEHPVFSRDSMAASKQHDMINGLNRTFYCGAYWRHGFHEDGVVSALAVCRHFDLTLKDLT
jgi:uncharacterized protein